jgi:hypothetical protein
MLRLVLPVALTIVGSSAGSMVMMRRFLLAIVQDVVTHSAQPNFALGALSVCIAGWLILGLRFVLSV